MKAAQRAAQRNAAPPALLSSRPFARRWRSPPSPFESSMHGARVVRTRRTPAAMEQAAKARPASSDWRTLQLSPSPPPPLPPLPSFPLALQSKEQESSDPRASPTYAPEDVAGFLLRPSPSPSPSEIDLSVGRVEERLSFDAFPLRMLRQSSFGVDEPHTATIRTMEDEQEDEEERAEPSTQRYAYRQRLLAVEDEWSHDDHARDEDSYAQGILHSLEDSSRVRGASESQSSMMRASDSPLGLHPAQCLPRAALHSYHQLELQPLNRTQECPPAASPPRVFHSFLLMTLCSMLSVHDVCLYLARICKQWQRHAHDSIAHPTRRMQQYNATNGGELLFAELNRLSNQRSARQQLASMRSATHTSLQTRHRIESVNRVAPARRFSRPLNIVTSNQVPSVTLLQHLQLLPSSTAGASSGPSRFSLKSLLSSSAGLVSVTDLHCMLLSKHLVHLRVLRIYNGSGISNDGIKLLALQLRHLRILHIGHLSDLLINDACLPYIADGLTELHSLWLTQDTQLPQRTLWNPHPRTVFNLFSPAGVAKLKKLHATLHHLNLGGFRNLTTQGKRAGAWGVRDRTLVWLLNCFVLCCCSGLRLLSAAPDPLRLQSVHLNGWHINDDCLELLASAQVASLYHLHLFDVQVTAVGMRHLAHLRSLETLIMDHCNELDETGIDALVEESKEIVKEHAEETEHRLRRNPHAVTTESQPALSLVHLELNSCDRLPLASLLLLSLHPTLRTLLITGGTLRESRETVGAAEQILRQIEEISAGRISCNGGRRQRKRAARHRER